MPKKKAIVDTNVLVYAALASSPHHAACLALRQAGERGDVALVVTPQILAEFYAVLTSPAIVESPLSAAVAAKEIRRLARELEVIYVDDRAIARLLKILAGSKIRGRHVHDAAIVATAVTHNIRTIYTFDAGFSRFRGIAIRQPPALPS
jgi:toxin-antitoxin system PIN domain toxin